MGTAKPVEFDGEEIPLPKTRNVNCRVAPLQNFPILLDIFGGEFHLLF